MKQKKMSELHRINKVVLIQYAILTIILFVAYILEFVKGSRTLPYTLIFICFDFIPFILYTIVYKKNPESTKLKYILSIGFSLLYAFVLLTAAVPTTFAYIFMIYVAIIPYGDIRLCYITGGIAILANIGSIIYGFVTGSLTSNDLAMVEIQVCAIVIGAFFVGLATNVIGKVNAQKMDEIHEEKDKTEHILTNTLDISQGITFEDIEQCVSNIDEVSANLENVVTELVRSNETIVNGINMISSVTQEVSARANETLEDTEKNTRVVEEVTDVIFSIYAKAKQLNE